MTGDRGQGATVRRQAGGGVEAAIGGGTGRARGRRRRGRIAAVTYRNGPADIMPCGPVRPLGPQTFSILLPTE